MTGIDIKALKIVNYPDPRLRKACKPVDAFDHTLAALVEHMLELMHDAKGIGLAGPQVGILRRLFICNVTGEPGDDMIFINPELTDLEGDVEGDEGCLSIPEVTVKVRRASSCTIKARNLHGEPIESLGADLVARCWQHECDHLEGRLITDRMSQADKIANRKTLKNLESDYKRRAKAG